MYFEYIDFTFYITKLIKFEYFDRNFVFKFYCSLSTVRHIACLRPLKRGERFYFPSIYTVIRG